MEEQKKQQNVPTPNTPIPGSSEPDFSKMENLKLNDLETTTPVVSLISEANAEEEARPPKEEYKFENLGMRIQPTEEKRANISLGESGVIGIHKSKYHDQYRKLFLISFFVIIVTGLASVILRLYSRYVYFASQPIPDANYQTYIDAYKK